MAGNKNHLHRYKNRKITDIKVITPEIFSIFILKIYIFNLKIRICNLKICIFNLKIEISSLLFNFSKGHLQEILRPNPFKTKQPGANPGPFFSERTTTHVFIERLLLSVSRLVRSRAARHRCRPARGFARLPRCVAASGCGPPC